MRWRRYAWRYRRCAACLCKKRIVNVMATNTFGDNPAAEQLAGPASMRDRLFIGLKRGFHALQVRNYRLFWIGQMISQTGSWMQRTAQDWLVLQLTHSPFALGLVTAL